MFIYEPALLFSLSEIIMSPRVGKDARFETCRQCIEGLAWIHECGAMHCDIKPSNMGLKSLNPVAAFIFDFGSATFEKTSLDHYKGTIPYLAPEVLEIKCFGGRTPFNGAVDVWAMGLSCYQLLCRKYWPGLEMLQDHRGVYNSFRTARILSVYDDLAAAPTSNLTCILLKMLVEPPSMRISAAEALKGISEPADDDEVYRETYYKSKRIKPTEMNKKAL